ncbi:hypothetical protein pb186bvf_001593 [Paramecium bursaria]
MSESIILGAKREVFRQQNRKQGLEDLFRARRKVISDHWVKHQQRNLKFDYVIKGPIHESLLDDKLYLMRLKFWLDFKRIDYKEFRYKFAYHPEVLDRMDDYFKHHLEKQECSLELCFDIVRDAVYQLGDRQFSDLVFPKKKSKFTKAQKKKYKKKMRKKKKNRLQYEYSEKKEEVPLESVEVLQSSSKEQLELEIVELQNTLRNKQQLLKAAEQQEILPHQYYIQEKEKLNQDQILIQDQDPQKLGQEKKTFNCQNCNKGPWTQSTYRKHIYDFHQGRTPEKNTHNKKEAQSAKYIIPGLETYPQLQGALELSHLVRPTLDQNNEQPHSRTNKSEKIKILTWNVSSIKKETFEEFNQQRAHIVCLQETRRTEFQSSPSFTYFNKVRLDQMGGGLIIGVSTQFTTRDISHKFIELQEMGLEFIAVQAVNTLSHLIIFNFYIGNGLKFYTIKDYFNKVFLGYVAQLSPYQQLVVCGDFNFKNTPLKNFSFYPPLGVNTFRRCVIRNKKRKLLESRTDHGMIFPATKMTGQTTSTSMSDHKIISFSIEATDGGKPFQNVISFNKQKAYTLNVLAGANFQCFTTFYHFVKDNLFKCGVVQSQRIRLRQRKQKQQDFKDFLKTIEQNYVDQQTKEAFSKIQRIAILNPQKRDGSIFNAYFDDKGEIKFNSITENCLIKLGEISGVRKYSQFSMPSLQSLSGREVAELQEKCSYNKAVNYDGISDNFIRKTKSWLILNDLWNDNTRQVNPLVFRARLVPLNKAHPDIPKSNDFRPIVVLSSLYKFMELRFLRNLNEYLCNTLNKEQQGFIPGSGTSVCHSRLINILKREQGNKSSKKICLFIDFRSAYNCVNRKKLFSILKSKKIFTFEELKFLKAFQNNLYFQFENGEKFSLINGVPQGSPLSPALFNIYMEEFVKKLRFMSEVHFDCIIYADDLTLVFLEQDTRLIIGALEQVAIIFNLQVNKKKCGMFKLASGNTDVEVLGYPVVKEYKFLGVWINQQGQVNPQVRQLEKSLQIGKKLRWISNPLSFRFRLILWKLYILPRFLYMLPAVMVSGDQAVFNRLEVLWRKSQRECLKLPKCCSNDFLDLLVGPLKDWGFVIELQLQSKIKNRICDLKENEDILYKLSHSLSQKWGKASCMGKIQKTGSQTFKNLPKNLELLFYSSLGLQAPAASAHAHRFNRFLWINIVREEIEESDVKSRKTNQ